MRRKGRIPTHSYVQRAIARLLEAVRGVPVRGVDGDSVAAGLQGEGDVDDEAFGATDTEVWVDYCYVGGLSRHFVLQLFLSFIDYGE